MIGADVDQLEQELGIQFRDKATLQQAFIHRSYLNELTEEHDLADNERLEFLGDSVLGFIVSRYLYEEYPEYQEGPLTNLRAALVRRETLARLATKLDFGSYLWLGHGEEESQGRDRPATLCAVFEAFVGALFVDQGIPAARDFVLSLMIEELTRVQDNALEKDPKSRLQEWVQSNMNLTPRYRMAESHGPDHDKTFVMLVLIDGKGFGVAQGRSKQEATQSAAAMALDRLGESAPEYTPNPELEERFGLV
ncbi:MAG: ribonuclease III [Caldilineaceae bacterium]